MVNQTTTDEDVPCSVATSFNGLAFWTLFTTAYLIYIVRKRTQVTAGPLPAWGKPYRLALNQFIIAFLNSFPQLVVVFCFFYASKDMYDHATAMVCNVGGGWFVPLFIVIRPVLLLWWHSYERLLPVAELLARRIRGACDAAGAAAPPRVLLVGGWGRGYLTHEVTQALRQAAGGSGGKITAETVHFDDEEDGCLRRNVELAGGVAAETVASQVHLALLEDGLRLRRVGGSSPWWTPFGNQSFDVVVILPKTGQAYPVKPTNMTAEDHRAARMAVILAEAVRVTKGQLFIVDEPYSALTTLADLRLVAEHASDEAVTIDEDATVKIGQISARFDSRCIVIAATNLAAKKTESKELAVLGASYAEDAAALGGSMPVAINDGSDAETKKLLQRDSTTAASVAAQHAVIHNFQFGYCMALDWVVFVVLTFVAFALGAEASVPTVIPEMLRVGAAFGYWPLIYTSLSLFVRWAECDKCRYDAAVWQSAALRARLYFRTQCLTFVLLTAFILIFNGPFFFLYWAIGETDIVVSLITLNAVLKAGFFIVLIAYALLTIKKRQRKLLVSRGISEATLVSYFDA